MALKRLGVVEEIKNDSEDGRMIATIEMSDGERVALRTSADISEGDVVEIVNVRNGYEIKAVEYFDKEKIHSPKYGFTYEKDSVDGNPFYIPEIADGKVYGQLSRGYLASSYSGAMIGFGITNYTYYDDTTKYTKSLNRVGIEGNKVYGESLAKGISASFYLASLDTDKYIKSTTDKMRKAVTKAINNIPFLVNTIGIHGFLYVASSTIYKIEASGKGCLSNFISINDIELVNNEVLHSNLEPIRAYVSNYIDLSDVISFEMLLYPADTSSSSGSATATSKGNSLAVELNIILFNKNYMINSLIINHKEGVFQYTRNNIQTSNKYKFDTDSMELITNNIDIPKPFYLNKDTGQLTVINEEQLRVSIKNLKFAVTEFDIVGTDKITLEVDGKGLLVDMAGTSHLS